MTGFEEDKTNADRQDNIKILNHAIDQLPQDKRELIMLSKYDGMKYKDIGELLKCSENTVKIRVFRALKDLKSIFENEKKSHG